MTIDDKLMYMPNQIKSMVIKFGYGNFQETNKEFINIPKLFKRIDKKYSQNRILFLIVREKYFFFFFINNHNLHEG